MADGRKRSVRDRDNNSDHGSNPGTYFKLKKSVMFFMVAVFGLNVLNGLIYNTGAFEFEKSDFDIIWSTSIIGLNIIGALVLILFTAED